MAALRKWVVAATAAATVVAIAAVLAHRAAHRGEIKSLTGVVLADTPDPGKQFPLENATIAVAGAQPAETVKSDPSGLFHLTLRGAHSGDALTLEVRRAGYRPLNVIRPAANELYVIRLTSTASAEPTSPTPMTTLANLRVRFAVKGRETINVGSAAKVFQVVNTGNVPCGTSTTCSPDHKWKATVGGASLDAGDGNEFRDTRVSCIGGPCPFTTIVKDGFSHGGQTISVSVEAWSDTVTFLMEAEVTRMMISDAVLQSFPAISDTSMDFTLPPTAQGPSIEAEVNGSDIVFPLGPNLDLPWATCHIKLTPGRSGLYHCDLKPGYQFKPAGNPTSGP